MQRHNKWLLGFALGLVTIIVVFKQQAESSQIEHAAYRVIQHDGAIEVREYPSLLVAEVETIGEREPAINQGFRLLADYIFGQNVSRQKVEMTAPVIQQSVASHPNAKSKGETIAMTAPVVQQATGNNTWRVQFVMPSAYTMETLPKPYNPAVKLKQLPSRQFAVIRFSGRGTQAALDKHLAQLQQVLKQKRLTVTGQPMYAFFNPPWTLPLLRRNEIMLELNPPA